MIVDVVRDLELQNFQTEYEIIFCQRERAMYFHVAYRYKIQDIKLYQKGDIQHIWSKSVIYSEVEAILDTFEIKNKIQSDYLPQISRNNA